MTVPRTAGPSGLPRPPSHAQKLKRAKRHSHKHISSNSSSIPSHRQAATPEKAILGLVPEPYESRWQQRVLKEHWLHVAAEYDAFGSAMLRHSRQLMTGFVPYAARLWVRHRIAWYERHARPR